MNGVRNKVRKEEKEDESVGKFKFMFNLPSENVSFITIFITGSFNLLYFMINISTSISPPFLDPFSPPPLILYPFNLIFHSLLCFCLNQFFFLISSLNFFSCFVILFGIPFQSPEKLIPAFLLSINSPLKMPP